MPSPVIVIGAGPAGLAVAAVLSRHGVAVEVLESGIGVGSRWRRHHDGLRLNTVRWLSHLPGRRIPRRCGRWIGRDDFVEYLDSYASRQGLVVHTETRARRVDPDRGGSAGTRWRIDTDRGVLGAAAVVVATGAFAQPVMPDCAGLDGYEGELHHASRYRSPGPYVGRRVLVVGNGASGLEIALLLADGGAAGVDLSVRSAKNLFTREVGGIPTTPVPLADDLPAWLLDLAGCAIRRGLGKDWPAPLPRAREGIGTRLRRGEEPSVADGVVEALRAGRIGLRPAVTAFERSEVRFEDGTRLRPDAVIVATGYRPALEGLVGHLGVLDENGRPAVADGLAPAETPGLVFVGFEPSVTGRLVQVRRRARRAARSVRSVLGRSGASRTGAPVVLA